MDPTSPPPSNPDSIVRQAQEKEATSGPPPRLFDSVPDYTRAGPYTPRRLPRLEHTATSLFPRCVVNECLLRLDVTVTSRSAPTPSAQRSLTHTWTGT